MTETDPVAVPMPALDAPNPDSGAPSHALDDHMPAGLAARVRRKRTKKACARCRLRKCRECVFEQPVHKRSSARPTLATEASPTLAHELEIVTSHPSPKVLVRDSPSTATVDPQDTPQQPPIPTNPDSIDELYNSVDFLLEVNDSEFAGLDDFFAQDDLDQNGVKESGMAVHIANPEPPQNNLASTRKYPSRSMPFILFSCYRFVEPGLMHELSSDDAAFLEQRGCFHLPSRPALDEFVRQYFAHFHPILPLLNESAFWRMYSSQDRSAAPHNRMPLFVLQSMLFVSCPFVPAQILRNLGFVTVQAARTEFYSRAKTLFDFNLHKDNISNAQGALMLTYHFPTTTDTVNTYWLISAIHFARSARADEYYTVNFCAQERQILKRLWWCCIVRDRVMSLSLRRPLNIRPDDFDFTQPGLEESDFLNEFRGSNVYDISTKRLLVRIIASLCELAVVLSGVLTILHPMGKSSAFAPKKTEKDVKSHLELLDLWYRKSRGLLQTSAPKANVNASPILFTKMIHIYYQYETSQIHHVSFTYKDSTAKMSICHHMMLLSITDYENPADAELRRLQSRSALETSLQGIANDLKELDQLGLIVYLPNTFVAFLAFPFTWNILEAKVLSAGAQSEDSQRNLTAYTSVMKRFRNMYESTESTLQSIEKTVIFIKANESLKPSTQATDIRKSFLSKSALSENARSNPTQRSRDAWADLLVGNPHTYLRIALTVDYSLTHGQCPSEGDIPQVLQSLDLNELLPDGDAIGDAISFASNSYALNAGDAMAPWVE
ncbi:hypothetical protein AK830_g5386 [Neonectria ditissima]|uniref:Xylanolytic transcriptional activator regulatory domain-containing protein n=1 Tax=Neonectria ditissima TaxID=78410 RepID=A0A0P7BL67_9HYPO|nr:hypothetical protein AK830_g5386 [Neonectria ditissima]